MGDIFGKIGFWLARHMSADAHIHSAAPATRSALLLMALRPGDVVLVEGTSRFSVAIKYLTQSTWSHAAMYVGEVDGVRRFVEADVIEGVRLVGVEEFAGFHTRICRPVGLDAAGRDAVVAFMIGCLGHQYDLRNVIDLCRYLLPVPLPQKWRRRALMLGSGEPTRAICSTLVARAFQSVKFPILPLVRAFPAATPACPDCIAEVFRAREVSFFVPRDFDVSPYFEIVKPSLPAGFDFRAIEWEG
jgi:cell wall-associated NlpC family hydrolase